MRLFLLAMFLLFPFEVWAGPDHILYFGGGGEPANKSSTAVDDELTAFSAFTRQRDLTSEVYYTHRQKQSFDLACNVLGKCPAEFTVRSFESRIEKLNGDISSGAIKPGQSVLLVLSSHGTDISGEYELDAPDGKIRPLAQLQKLINEAEKKGVKLAIVNTTCTSGNIMKLATEKTCVLAQSVPEHPAFTSDGISLFLSFISQSNLESAYLTARKRAGLATLIGRLSQPMISTAAGRKTDEALKSLRTYIHDEDKLRERIERSQVCPEPLSEIDKLIQEMGPISRRIEVFGYGFDVKGDELQSLRGIVGNFNESYAAYRAESAAMKDNMVCLKSDSGVCVADETDRKTKLKAFAEIQNVAISRGGTDENLATVREITAELANLKRAPNWVAAMRKRHEQERRLLKHERAMRLAARQISEIERRIYGRIYEHYSKELKDRKNPCAEFKL